MIKTWTIIFTIISSIVCILFPIVLTAYLNKKEKISLKPVITGALVFLIFQPLTRLPLLRYLEGKTWFMVNVSSSIIVSSLFYGLTAGIFEECGRYLAFKFILKKNNTWKDGIAFGVGHGGIEAIFIGIMGPLLSVINMFLINSGKFNNKSSINYFTQMPSYMMLYPGIERLLTMTIQIALTLVVLYAVYKNNFVYLILAILLHALVDSPILLIKNTTIVEIYILIAAIISLIFIFKSKYIFYKGNN